MLIRPIVAIASILALVSLQPVAQADDAADTDARPAQIQWFGTWRQAKAEAERTGRPILLSSAAPQCAGIPGMW